MNKRVVLKSRDPNGTKFWTFQRKSVLKKLTEGAPIICDWSKKDVHITGSSLLAYQYVLDLYKEGCNVSTSGLIFGHVGIPEFGVPEIESEDRLYKMIQEVGEPSGSQFSSETHVLLEVTVPSGIPIMVIDFYRFCDLMFFFEDDDGSGITLEDVKEDLFLPNGDIYELPTGHIPYIMPEWDVRVHIPR